MESLVSLFCGLNNLIQVQAVIKYKKAGIPDSFMIYYFSLWSGQNYHSDICAKFKKCCK